jgi:hypothetical protein
MYEYRRHVCRLPQYLFCSEDFLCTVESEYSHSTQQLSEYSLNLTADLCQTQWRTSLQYVMRSDSGENPYCAIISYDIVQSDINILKKHTVAKPLLCNNIKMGVYTRAVSGQQFSKHVPMK